MSRAVPRRSRLRPALRAALRVKPEVGLAVIGTRARLRAGHGIVGRRLGRGGAGGQRAGDEESNGEEGSNGHASLNRPTGAPSTTSRAQPIDAIRLSGSRARARCAARTCDSRSRLLRGSRAALALTAVPTAHAATPKRAFGAYVDPWHVAEWTAKVGAAPQFVGRFEAFSRGATVDEFLRESERQGLRRVLVIVGALAARAGGARRRRGVPRAARLPQPRHRGRRPGRVHPRASRAAWRRSRPRRPALRARDERHLVPVVARPGRLPARVAARSSGCSGRRARATSASSGPPNPSLYLPVPDLAAQRPRLLARPPLRGRRGLDDDQLRRREALRRRSASRPACTTLRRLYRKPVLLTEVSTAHRGRLRWLRARCGACCAGRRGSARWPGSSTAAAVRPSSWATGRLDWDVQARSGRRRDPARHHPRRAAIAGRNARTTGTKTAAQTAPITVHTTHAGASAVERVAVPERRRDRRTAPRSPTSRRRTRSSAPARASLPRDAPRAAAQVRLAQQVDEDVVAVAVEERVEVEAGAEVGAERELEADVAHRPGRRAAGRRSRTRAPSVDVGRRAGGADRDPPPARLEPRLRGVDERVREDEHAA